MKQVMIVVTSLVVSVLIMLVEPIFSYGQLTSNGPSTGPGQAAPPPGFPSADNSTNSTGFNPDSSAGRLLTNNTSSNMTSGNFTEPR